MGGIYFNFKTGRAGTSRDNINYITRETATKGDREALFIQNYPEYGQEGDTYKKQKNNLAEYARQQEEDELKKGRRGTGEARTHYRAIASFEGKFDTAKAKEMAKEYLEKRFPNARAVAVVHQDTKQTHVHFHIQARDADGKKINFKGNEWKEIDKEWNKIYSREFGKEKEVEHLRKKTETRDWKESLIKGEKKEKPERVNTVSKKMYVERDRRNAGVYELKESRTGGNQRGTTVRDRADETRVENRKRDVTNRELRIERGERAINNSIDNSKRANEQFNRTESRARELSDRTDGLRGAVKNLGKEKNRLDRDR